MFEKMSEANLFAMKSRKVKYKGAPVAYAQRAVNFQYFKHRFASRQMQCQGRFNPWFVVGFPGLMTTMPLTLTPSLLAFWMDSSRSDRLRLQSLSSGNKVCRSIREGVGEV